MSKEELVFYCNEVCGLSIFLDCGEKWPLSGSLNYCNHHAIGTILPTVNKWDEI